MPNINFSHIKMMREQKILVSVNSLKLSGMWFPTSGTTSSPQVTCPGFIIVTMQPDPGNEDAIPPAHPFA